MTCCLLCCAAGVSAKVKAKDEVGVAPHKGQARQIWRAIVISPEGKKDPPGDVLLDFKRLVKEALAPMGVNVVIFDMHWRNYRFTCRPEFAKVQLPKGRAFTKKDAQYLARICRANGIGVMVGMNFLTHQNHGQMLKAFPQYSWPGTDRLWDPLNPKVNEVAFAMADELIEAFQADGFHVGMDEGWDFNPGTHPKAKDYSAATLFAKCVTDYHQHLVGKRGVKMLMWSDMLEDRHRKGTSGALDLIPKDIIMCHWEYGFQSNYPWLQKLVDRGFCVLGCPFKNPKATHAMVESVLKIDDAKMLGVLYTTWSNKIAYELRDALLQTGEQAKLDNTIKGIAEGMRRTLPMLMPARNHKGDQRDKCPQGIKMPSRADN